MNGEQSPHTRANEWNQHTLDHMHPVYRKRCEWADMLPLVRPG